MTSSLSRPLRRRKLLVSREGRGKKELCGFQRRYSNVREQIFCISRKEKKREKRRERKRSKTRKLDGIRREPLTLVCRRRKETIRLPRMILTQLDFAIYLNEGERRGKERTVITGLQKEGGRTPVAKLFCTGGSFCGGKGRKKWKDG